jgi:hypothetical protein
MVVVLYQTHIIKQNESFDHETDKVQRLKACSEFQKDLVIEAQIPCNESNI